jgi:S1-C subfamily serine protease
MLTQLSDEIASVVNGAAASVIQVQGHRSPASGVIYDADLVLTTARAVGREEHPRVQRSDGQSFDAEIAGWDPATRLLLLKAPKLGGSPLSPGAQPRVGHIAIAIARSWSNSVTATMGFISVIGGPLATGRHRQIDQVFRMSAPMHEGFAGGAVLDGNGGLLGIATATSIRGLGVVIPASIAWTAATELVRGGRLKRGYLGISAQPVSVTAQQKSAGAGDVALLILNVKEGTPASQAGLLVGDLLLSLDGHPVTATDDLFDLLVGERVGRPLTLQVLRGNAPLNVTVTIAER